VQEPRRLWRRYAFLNPLFVGLLLLQALRIRTPSLDQAYPPTDEMRHG
jgi:hypothetical protein